MPSNCGFWDICADGSAGGLGANYLLGTSGLFDWVFGTNIAAEYYTNSRTVHSAYESAQQTGKSPNDFLDYYYNLYGDATQRSVNDGVFRQAAQNTVDQIGDDTEQLLKDIKTIATIVAVLYGGNLLLRLFDK